MSDAFDELRRQHEADLIQARRLLMVRDVEDPDIPVPAGEMARTIMNLLGLLHPIWSTDPEIERTWARVAYGHYMAMSQEDDLYQFIRMRDNLQALQALVESLARCMPRELQMKLGVPKGGEPNA